MSDRLVWIAFAIFLLMSVLTMAGAVEQPAGWGYFGPSHADVDQSKANANLPKAKPPAKKPKHK